VQGYRLLGHFRSICAEEIVLMTDEANRILLPLFSNIRLGKLSHNSHFIASIFTDQLDDLTHCKTIMVLKEAPDTKRH
jgi:hypothetical protein